ncbi:MAG: hypothetical protein WA006_03260 [Rhodoglobus sp.]
MREPLVVALVDDGAAPQLLELAIEGVGAPAGVFGASHATDPMSLSSAA